MKATSTQELGQIWGAHHSGHKLVVDGFLHEQPPGRNAVLSFVEKDSAHALAAGEKTMLPRLGAKIAMKLDTQRPGCYLEDSRQHKAVTRSPLGLASDENC